MAAACGDRCERLCRDVSFQLESCLTPELAWTDLGARSRADFVDECRLDWDRTSAGLKSSDLAESLDICRSGSDLLEELSCDDLVALYIP